MTESATARQLVETYLKHLAVVRGLSPNTVRAYATDLERYLEWAERAELDPLSLTHRQMRLYLAEMDRAHYGRRTIARRLSALRSLFAYSVAEGFTTSDPASVLLSPKAPARLPRVIPSGELETLLNAPARDSACGVRDAAVLELLYASGARVGEISSLTLRGLDLSQGQVTLMGKGSKERIAPLYPAAITLLRVYVQEARPSLARAGSPDNLFLSARGNRFSEDAIRRMFKKYLTLAGATTTLSPHAVRHTFATHMLDAGADLRTVQELLGHVALSTTQIYTHMSVNRLKDVHSNAHPRA